MSQNSTIIPPGAQDIDPTAREKLEEKLNKSGAIQLSKRNPEGKLQHENVGTPQMTEQELKDREIIKANREVMFRSEPLIRAVTEKIRNSPLRIAYIVAIEDAIKSVDAE